jgi:hypothetical protein
MPANAGMPSMRHASTLANNSAMSSLPDKRYALYCFTGTGTNVQKLTQQALTYRP